MKYADEVAQVATVKLAKRKRYLQDIDGVIQDYERLLSHEAGSRRQVEVLEKDLRAMRRARDNAKAELNSANDDRKKLRSALKALRSSKSLRVGQAILAPARSLARAFGDSGTPTRAIPASPEPTSRAGSGRSSSRKSDGSVDRSAAVKPVSASTVSVVRREDLFGEFAAQPSKAAAMKLISHDYFVEGAILEPAEFILQNPALLADLAGSELALVQNILGQRELLTREQFLSPRQPNAGYAAERNRIMYCAHSTGHFNSNGYSTRTGGVVAGLNANGEDVLVVARPGYPWDSKVDVEVSSKERFEREISGVTHIYNPGPSWTVDRLDYYLAEAVDVYVREAQRNRVSLIQSASNYVTALPALMAARRLGIPFAYEVRGLWEVTQLSNNPGWRETDRFNLAVKLETLVATESDLVLAITSQVRDELVRRGIDSSLISLMPNSVDTDTFSPMPALEPLRRKLGLAETTTVVGYAGSLVAYEGLDDLLDAAKLVLDEGLDVTLVIVGDGVQLPELKRRAVELGIADNVKFTGRVPAGEIPNYVSLFDIMPCPRRRLPVTEMVSPLKPLEAMASAKALILSDLAPLRDLAGPDQGRALLSEAGNPNSLAEAITVLARDSERRTAMGRRARLWAIDERTWRSTGSKAVAAHGRAGNSVAPAAGRKLSELTVGIIADEFTLEGMRGETSLVELRPDSWRQQIDAQPLDALFVESAWEGIDGSWKQKVGYYDDERFTALRAILEHCNNVGVPTIFWNKEDPVHFNRFSRTAAHFDHVFTTDSDCIRRYKADAGPRQRTVASLPFYAQPRLHNIVPSDRPYDHSVAYAGSYYGDRYKVRSEELATVLDVAENHGLAIYDRQHLNPESPYRFPDHLTRYVRGGLSYAEMVDAYKSHPVHINVNSVEASPTMFSRRVMEVAASGSAVLSGRGIGVEHIMNGLVPVVEGSEEIDLLVTEWMNNEPSRIRDAWLAYRHVHRGHTAGHRLAYVLRTAGLIVEAPELPGYAVFVESLTPEIASVLAIQTVQPIRIYSTSGGRAGDLPVEIVADFADAAKLAKEEGTSFIGFPGTGHCDRTVFEDMLTATSFGTWSSVGISSDDLDVPGVGLGRRGSAVSGSPSLRALDACQADHHFCLRRELVPMDQPSGAQPPSKPKNVLVAGHDLKFATGLISELEALGHSVLIDKWTDHNTHDEGESQRLLAQADVIFCEWTLGNAVWYSKNKSSHQRLVTRLHLQEISRPFVKNVSYAAVDEVVFVGRHILEVAVRDHKVPREISRVVPNSVATVELRQDKVAGARFNLGFVGIVPARKRLDTALDVLRLLRMLDDRYRLFIKGKRPEDFAWMANRPEEMLFYDEQYRRIETDPLLVGAVAFDAQGDDMAAWYRKIGVVLSVSDFESFHLTLPDGAASGALPASLAWPGADQIYPTSWLHADARELAEFVGSLDEASWGHAAEVAQDYVVSQFESRHVLSTLTSVILGEGAADPARPEA
ncbi:glycosyltransferase [Arthrobacter sp. CG_A4]|uniref:glycosyltransferase n=1 Tax=Arthrobacter sp. CG_A4 TaxID=3071706 RepID=UPI002E04E128|nr:glycosyltransferase involved in cell wall biosynthesis/spore maturation protein CgeB [Arthrobacter sp. CG_A4]